MQRDTAIPFDLKATQQRIKAALPQQEMFTL